MKFIFYTLLFCSTFSVLAQKKELKTQFISEKIVIDGKLSEKSWESATAGTDFIMFEPDNGKHILPEKRTDVKVLYDNDAIYIAALLLDDEPQKILKELTPRDDFGTADIFGVFINGFNDGQQDFRFFVSAADTQSDCVASDSQGEDYSWDAVWDSKAVITDKGWVVEMKIPYAALRFSSEKTQTWGFNFFRMIKRANQKYVWNPVDNKIGAFTQQSGVLTGIADIKTPTRLFLLPYSSFYLNASKDLKTKGTPKGGLDIKYGINDAFTLDAILIPDFGQTKYDNKILNLTPFEQQFDENRAFFTEGTDLFSKGGLFYSRRIGGSPSYTLADNESYIENPTSVALINATKISGRTKDGLGIGFLNAVTEQTFATIYNADTNQTTSKTVEPLTNYNIFVLDQRFRKNSSFSIINTNVMRNGNFRDANVSGLIWDLNSKSNTFKISGDLKYSFVNDDNRKDGVSTNIGFADNGGKYRYNARIGVVTKEYDINDLGINYETNYYTLNGGFNYRTLKPTKHLNSFRTSLFANARWHKETNKIQENVIDIVNDFNSKNNNFYEYGMEIKPFEKYNYYEPRVANRYVIQPRSIENWFYLSTNYNYKFAIDFNPYLVFFDTDKQTTFGIHVTPRYRFSDKFSFQIQLDYIKDTNIKGYQFFGDADSNATTADVIVFGNRNVTSLNTAAWIKYSLNSKMTLNASFRHYWSFVENKNYLTLNDFGRLEPLDYFNNPQNQDFSSWNMDLSYNWWFAPGSQVSVLYRNNAAVFQNEINKNYSQNINQLLNNNALSHVFSISVKYFIDYNVAKNWL